MFFLRAGFHGKENNFDKKMRDLLNGTYIEGMKLVTSVVYHDTFEISELDSFNIPMKFKGIKYLTYFCSSIGVEIDKRIDFYQENNNLLKATLLDAWGSEAIEEVNEQFDRILRGKFGEGTMRFSPGYGEISTLENNNILDLLKVTEVVAHPSSGVLVPQKSTVCMIGWYSTNMLEEYDDWQNM